MHFSQSKGKQANVKLQQIGITSLCTSKIHYDTPSTLFFNMIEHIFKDEFFHFFL